jgi:hypothetical protein
METTNTRFFKSPPPEVYNKMKSERDSFINPMADSSFNNTSSTFRRTEIDT